MNEFKTYHPFVNFIYFLSVIGFSMFCMHPFFLIISFFCAFSYSVMTGGKKALKFNVIYMIPLFLLSALINSVFNQEGQTVLMYLPNNNPLTLEATVYGFSSSVMLASVICWFSCFNNIMTSDKLMYLFGKIIPSISLIFSMVLRFVPRFIHQMKKVSDAQKCLDCTLNHRNFLAKTKKGIKTISIMITWCLENGIETSDSMRSRGYGLKNRTAFSNYKFSSRDFKVLLFIILISAYIIVNIFSGQVYFQYFPSFSEIYNGNIFVFSAYLLLCFLPISIEVWEAYKWKTLKSKI